MNKMPATSTASLLLPDYSFEIPVPAPYRNQNWIYMVLKLFIIGLALKLVVAYLYDVIAE